MGLNLLYKIGNGPPEMRVDQEHPANAMVDRDTNFCDTFCDYFCNTFWRQKVLINLTLIGYFIMIISAIYKDVKKIVENLVYAFFFATPIIWSENMVSTKICSNYNISHISYDKQY